MDFVYLFRLLSDKLRTFAGVMTNELHTLRLRTTLHTIAIIAMAIGIAALSVASIVATYRLTRLESLHQGQNAAYGCDDAGNSGHDAGHGTYDAPLGTVK